MVVLLKYEASGVRLLSVAENRLRPGKPSTRCSSAQGRFAQDGFDLALGLLAEFGEQRAHDELSGAHVDVDMVLKMKSHLPNNQLAQYIFHGVWGTHWEDLELLRWMTGREFVDRRTFGEGFRKTSEAGYQSVRMIPFLYYYKRAQALTTRFTCPRNRLGQQQVSNKVTFAGKRTIPLTKSLTSYMGKSANWQVYETGSLLAALAKHKERVFNEFSKEGVRNLGTTDWYKSDTCSFEEHGEKVEPPTFNRSKLFKGALEDE
ncbi:unnamed protein product [Nesidiocoris tenuis]|uniref:Uncharacterized protein n=1 Tax=Nesidiocoris tenuis TaxID=355587 RepID=A0A6H5H395_9HEMI|nr:unnamed protein product [Nesidiocoris tenuis]